jgi:hypothetical protein
MDEVEVRRYYMSGSLLVASYLAAFCPCKDPFLSCHKGMFYFLVGLPLAIAIYDNEILGPKKA